MEKLRVAIVGVGSIAEAHIGAYRKNPLVELYAFCDINEKRLQEKGEKYQVSRLYTDEKEMLTALPEIDAVSICTWNNAHAPCTIMALEAGKHVLCEKPMAITAQEAGQMEDAAKKSGVFLMIGFVRRFGNDAKIIGDFINKGDLGELYYAKATYLRRAGCPGGWFGDKSRSGGGPLIDLGVHVIDLVRYLAGNPKPVSVYGATFSQLGPRFEVKGNQAYRSADKTDDDICDVEDMATALIRFDNGLVLSVEASFSLHIKQDEGCIELFGTKAGAKLNPQLEIFSENNGYMTNVSFTANTALDFDGLFEGEIDHFVACAADACAGRPVSCIAPAEDGVVLMRILDGIYESAKTGHEVVLS